MKTKKIISRRELSYQLSDGPVPKELVSSKLQRVVSLWLKRNEIKENGKFLVLA